MVDKVSPRPLIAEKAKIQKYSQTGSLLLVNGPRQLSAILGGEGLELKSKADFISTCFT
jgi:hypothetical protein